MNIFVDKLSFINCLKRNNIAVTKLPTAYNVYKRILDKKSITDTSLINIEKACDILRDKDFRSYIDFNDEAKDIKDIKGDYGAVINEVPIYYLEVDFDNNTTRTLGVTHKDIPDGNYILTRLEAKIFENIINSGLDIKWASNVKEADRKLKNSKNYKDLREILEKITEIYEAKQTLPKKNKPKNLLEAVTLAPEVDSELETLWKILKDNGYEVNYSYASFYEKVRQDDFWDKYIHDSDFAEFLERRYKKHLTKLDLLTEEHPSKMLEILKSEISSSKKQDLTSLPSEDPIWVRGMNNYIRIHKKVNKNYGIKIGQEDEFRNMELVFTSSPDIYIKREYFLIYFTYKFNKQIYTGKNSGSFYDYPPRFKKNTIIKLKDRDRFAPSDKPWFSELEKKLGFDKITEKEFDSEKRKEFLNYLLILDYDLHTIDYFMGATGVRESREFADLTKKNMLRHSAQTIKDFFMPSQFAYYAYALLTEERSEGMSDSSAFRLQFEKLRKSKTKAKAMFFKSQGIALNS